MTFSAQTIHSLRVLRQAEQEQRRCEQCGAVLVRNEKPGRRRERESEFAVRNYCDRTCSRAAQDDRHGNAVQWEPIIVDKPSIDRCWAGFRLRKRCVLERGHKTDHQY